MAIACEPQVDYEAVRALARAAAVAADEADQVGLAAAEVAGPVDVSKEGRLAVGDAVEVRAMGVGARGCWLPAIVKQVMGSSGYGQTKHECCFDLTCARLSGRSVSL